MVKLLILEHVVNKHDECQEIEHHGDESAVVPPGLTGDLLGHDGVGVEEGDHQDHENHET